MAFGGFGGMGASSFGGGSGRHAGVARQGFKPKPQQPGMFGGGGQRGQNQAQSNFNATMQNQISGGGTPGIPGGGAPNSPAIQGAGALSQFGQGMMDPNSDLSQRYMEQLQENIGDQTDAQERAAAYRAAQSGFGVGASPELMQMQTDIGVGGLEAAGDASSDFLMQAPQLGVGALSSAVGNQVGMRGQDLASRQAEQNMQFQREMGQAGLDMQGQQLSQDRYLRELAMLYSGF